MVVGGFSWKFLIIFLRGDGIDLNHTELVRFLDGLADTGHVNSAPDSMLCCIHLFKVHPVGRSAPTITTMSAGHPR